MPTGVTHAVVGLGLAAAFADRPMPLSFWGLSAAFAVLPDLDAIGFWLGVPYGSRFGHRGFSHSLCCALLVSLPIALWTAGPFGAAWWVLWGFFFIVMVLHSVLDALTNGGYGVAFFAPFDPTRYFFPWRPVQVAPIGIMAFFTPWGMRALRSELVWIWLPLAAVVGGAWLWRGAAFW